METSMKKLAVVAVMTAIATFMAVPMASAANVKNAIKGDYATTGPGSCLYSRSPFNANLTLPDSNNWIASKLAVGTWTFEKDGTGNAQFTVYGIATSQPAFPTATGDSSGISFEFTYTIANDGTITGEMTPGRSRGRISRDQMPASA